MTLICELALSLQFSDIEGRLNYSSTLNVLPRATIKIVIFPYKCPPLSDTKLPGAILNLEQNGTKRLVPLLNALINIPTGILQAAHTGADEIPTHSNSQKQ